MTERQKRQSFEFTVTAFSKKLVMTIKAKDYEEAVKKALEETFTRAAIDEIKYGDEVVFSRRR